MELSMRNVAGENGSGLLLAMFVVVLLTVVGVVLLSVMDTELRTSQADHRSKKAYFIAEAGFNHGREVLRVMNLASTDPDRRFTEALRTAAGPDPTDPGLGIDVDPANIRPVYDEAGALVGLSGAGDDTPLVNKSAIGDGWYYAFLVNDDIDVELGHPLTDTNNRVKIVGVGVGPHGTFEIVEGVVSSLVLTPPAMPATILMTGPSPDFRGGASNSKHYSGDDCETGPSVPVVGVFGGPAEKNAEVGVLKPALYTTHDNGEPSVALTGLDTIIDLTKDDGFDFDASWNDCERVAQLASQIRDAADVVGDSSLSNDLLGTKDAPKIVFIDGDYAVNPSDKNLGGVLVVTGVLTMSGSTDWYGPILVVGKGIFEQNGAGNGSLLGANVVANVSGNDGIFGTKDDCAGPDGAPGNSDDGFGRAAWDVSGMGTGTNRYCRKYIEAAFDNVALHPTHFRQW